MHSPKNRRQSHEQIPKAAALIAAWRPPRSPPRAAPAPRSPRRERRHADGDERSAADTITLAAAGGFITVNGPATTLAADDNAKIVVNAGDGADTVDASALAVTNYATLTINGGEGDDLLTGGAGTTTCAATAAKTASSASRATTTSKAGTATTCSSGTTATPPTSMDGDAGADEVEINGSPTAGDNFTAVPNGRAA